VQQRKGLSLSVDFGATGDFKTGVQVESHGLAVLFIYIYLVGP
jgi:hypothetical protein